MNEKRLTKEIVSYFRKKKTTTAWIKEVRRDQELLNITESQMLERNIFRSQEVEVFLAEGRHLGTN